MKIRLTQPNFVELGLRLSLAIIAVCESYTNCDIGDALLWIEGYELI